MMNKGFSNLGLAMRAGKLVTGEEGVLEAVRTGEAKLVVVAVDASDNTRKKIADKCSYYNIPLIVYGSRSELGGSIGKPERVVMAVNDAGFAKLIGDRLRAAAE